VKNIVKLSKSGKINMRLQDQLVEACEQGDLEGVKTAIRAGALPMEPSSVGRILPLGAAVVGMNPSIVDFLIQEMQGITPITWEEIEAHNHSKYGKVFLVSEFKAGDLGKWKIFLHIIEPSRYISQIHIGVANMIWHHGELSSIHALEVQLDMFLQQPDSYPLKEVGLTRDLTDILSATERACYERRTEIIRIITRAEVSHSLIRTRNTKCKDKDVQLPLLLKESIQSDIDRIIFVYEQFDAFYKHTLLPGFAQAIETQLKTWLQQCKAFKRALETYKSYVDKTPLYGQAHREITAAINELSLEITRKFPEDKVDRLSPLLEAIFLFKIYPFLNLRDAKSVRRTSKHFYGAQPKLHISYNTQYCNTQYCQEIPKAIAPILAIFYLPSFACSDLCMPRGNRDFCFESGWKYDYFSLPQKLAKDQINNCMRSDSFNPCLLSIPSLKRRFKDDHWFDCFNFFCCTCPGFFLSIGLYCGAIGLHCGLGPMVCAGRAVVGSVVGSCIELGIYAKRKATHIHRTEPIQGFIKYRSSPLRQRMMD
jgi:hypothetical protein